MKNQGMFIAGIAIMFFQLLGLGFAYLLTLDTRVSPMSMTSANTIFAAVFFGLLNIVALVFIVVGASKEE